MNWKLALCFLTLMSRVSSQACGIGYYSVDGNAPCSICSAGKTSVAGAMNCFFPCRQQGDSNPVCAACDGPDLFYNFYIDQSAGPQGLCPCVDAAAYQGYEWYGINNQSPCYSGACPDHSTLAGDGACYCNYGYAQSTQTGACVAICPLGQYYNSSQQCETCFASAGYECVNYQRVACVAGMFSIGNNASCVACASGTSSAQASGSCDLCDIGYYSSNGSIPCDSCSSGMTSVANATGCFFPCTDPNAACASCNGPTYYWNQFIDPTGAQFGSCSCNTSAAFPGYVFLGLHNQAPCYYYNCPPHSTEGGDGSCYCDLGFLQSNTTGLCESICRYSEF